MCSFEIPATMTLQVCELLLLYHTKHDRSHQICLLERLEVEEVPGRVVSCLLSLTLQDKDLRPGLGVTQSHRVSQSELQQLDGGEGGEGGLRKT